MIEAGALDLLQQAVRERSRVLRMEARRCRKQCSEESVHDLRVAMRRLLALIDYLAFFTRPPSLRKVQKEIKSHLDAFDALRDTQVMLLETNQRLAELPEIEPFHLHLLKSEKRLLRAAQKDIQNLGDSYAKVLKGALKAASASSYDALAPVDDAYQTVLHRLALIDAANTATVHRVRIAFKRFRYSVEVVKPLLSTLPDDLMDRLHAYQTLMGEIQDMEVMLRAIDAFASRRKDSFDGIERMRTFYQQMHQQRVQAYLEHMNEVYSFWRSTPDKPLPWEVAE